MPHEILKRTGFISISHSTSWDSDFSFSFDISEQAGPSDNSWAMKYRTHTKRRGHWMVGAAPETQDLDPLKAYHLADSFQGILKLNLKILWFWSSHRGTMATNPTRNHEDTGLIPGLDQWVKDLVLLWLWCRLAAVALIWPLAWDTPYAAGIVLKRQKNKKIIKNLKILKI